MESPRAHCPDNLYGDHKPEALGYRRAGNLSERRPLATLKKARSLVEPFAFDRDAVHVAPLVIVI